MDDHGDSVVHFNLTHNIAMSTRIYFLVGDSVEAKITSPCRAGQHRPSGLEICAVNAV